MQYIKLPASSGASPSDVEQAVIDALEAVFATNTVATRFHDCAVTNIEADSGAFVQVGTRAVDNAVLPVVKELNVNATFGQPIEFRIGADATAADANPTLFLINKGAAVTLKVLLPAGERLWVRSLSSTAVASGILTLDLMA
jgi:hypothetical protein